MIRTTKLVLLALCLLALPMGAAVEPRPGAHATADEHARLWTTQAEWSWPATPHAVPLCFWFTNEADHTLWLPSSAPWHIEDEAGNLVYDPIALTAIFPVHPGDSDGGCWDVDQLFMSGIAPAGGYRIAWAYYTDDMATELRELRLPVTLVAPV